MKNCIIIALWLIEATNYAQTQRADTIVLSVYNNNMRYMLTPADFSPATLSQNITGEMVAAYDTLISIKGKADSTKNKIPRFEISRSCNKPLGDLKDKIVLMDLNIVCDVTMMCLQVQRAGAKAFIIVHNSNSKLNLKLPKLGFFKDSIRIPIFTVRKQLGENINSLLPSLVGISLRIPPSQALAQSTLINPTVQQQKDKEKNVLNIEGVGNKEGIELETASNLTGLTANEWRISPNPTSHTATLSYYFTQSAPLSIEVFNAAGQLIKQYKLNSSVGTLDIDVSTWSNGVYNVRLVSDNQKAVKRLVVAH